GYDARPLPRNLALPRFFDSLEPELNGDVLELPVAKEIPVIAMGMGVGGSSAESGGWCVQVSPPHLVEMLGLGDLRFGDLVACKDALMSYGKGYYKGAVTVGVVTTGESQIAGQGPSVVAIASSKRGKIKPRVDVTANVAKYLKLLQDIPGEVGQDMPASPPDPALTCDHSLGALGVSADHDDLVPDAAQLRESRAASTRAAPVVLSLLVDPVEGDPRCHVLRLGPAEAGVPHLDVVLDSADADADLGLAVPGGDVGAPPGGSHHRRGDLPHQRLLHQLVLVGFHNHS
ncbi:DUF4438 domain-containing protein, partial [archaeon]|nr:DUF4438 domain-containing protein [archaeon]